MPLTKCRLPSVVYAVTITVVPLLAWITPWAVVVHTSGHALLCGPIGLAHPQLPNLAPDRALAGGGWPPPAYSAAVAL